MGGVYAKAFRGGARVKLLVNGKEQEIREGATVASLVPEGRRGIAVAVDGAVVPRAAWADLELSGGQRVEILEAQAGG